MDNVPDNTVEGLDAEERATEAALQAIKDKKAKLREEAEERRKTAKAEAKQKPEEAELKEAEANEAERVANEAAEKKKAEAVLSPVPRVRFPSFGFGTRSAFHIYSRVRFPSFSFGTRSAFLRFPRFLYISPRT
jgi:hypothetical protein